MRMNQVRGAPLSDRLPQNLEAERSVLGAILLDNHVLNAAIEKLKPEDFFLDQHRRVFGCMVEMGDTQQVIDLVTLYEQLHRKRELEAAGGAAYLAQLVDGVPRVSHVEHYAQIVKENALRRSVIHAGHVIQQAALDTEEDADAILDRANVTISSLKAASRSPGEQPLLRYGWPDPAAPAAFYGLAGDFVKTIAPHSEADEHALIGQFLAMFGNAAGRASYFPIEADRHTTNINIVLVGDTASGRKGVSLSQARRPFESADKVWAESGIQSGLSSGEGLIWAVRDPIEREDPIKEHGRVVGYETVITDKGIEDKRVLVVETELSSTLKVAEREGNTLTGVVRQAWDTGSLRLMTKTSPAKSTGAHISIVGHIPKDELLHCMGTTELGNGFANRFLWLCVRRSKELPEGGHLTGHALDPVINRLQGALEFAKHGGQMRRDSEAKAMWCSVYGALSSRKSGLLGAVLSRAEAQVTRLSLLYALLDCSLVIRAEHLQAALALWEYTESSVRCIFADAIGDPVADAILEALRTNTQGLTRTELSTLFSRHRDKQRLEMALAVLRRQDLARPAWEQTGGRPVEKWVATRLDQTGRAT